MEICPGSDSLAGFLSVEQHPSSFPASSDKVAEDKMNTNYVTNQIILASI